MKGELIGMGIIFTDKVEHRHGSKKVSRKTAKIEMKIKQEELKQLKQQRRQQQWLDLQERVQQQQVQQQEMQQLNNVPTYVETPTQVETTPTINQETKDQVNQATLEKMQEQQAKLTELLTYQQQLKANKPSLTKLESFITIMTVLITIFTLPTIIIPCLTIVISGCTLNKMDTEHNRHSKELARVKNEIQTTQKLLQELRNNLF